MRLIPVAGLWLALAGYYAPARGQEVGATGTEADQLLLVPGEHEDDGNDIVVTASIGHHAPDRRSYDVRSPDAGSLNSREAIARLPGVIVDTDGKLSMLGETRFAYTIDDQFVPEELALSLPASLIARIEVVTNPGASSGSSAGVVINIVLKAQKRRAGRELLVRAVASSNTSGEASLTYQTKGPWEIITNATADFSRRRSDTLTNDVLFGAPGPGVSTQISEVSASLREQSSLGSTISVLRKPGNDRVLALLCYAKRTTDASRENRSREFTGGTLAPWLAKVDGRSLFAHFFASCAPSFVFQRHGESFYQLSASLSYSDRKSTNHQRLSVYAFPDAFFFGRNGDAINYGLELKRKKEFNRRSKIEFGVKFNHSLISNDYEFGFTSSAAPYPINEKSVARKTEASGYFTYQFHLGNFDILSGLRLTSLNLDHAINSTDLPNRFRRTWFLPSLHIDYPIGGGVTLKSSFTEKTQNPSEDYFNPILLQTGYNIFLIGSADIDIGKHRRYELSMEYIFKKGSINLLIYKNNHSNYIFPLIQHIGDDKYLIKYANATRDVRIGFNLNGKQSLASQLDLSIDFDLFQQSFRWQQDGLQGSDRWTWTAKGNLAWQIDRSDSLLLTAQFTGPRIDLDRSRSGEFTSSLKYSHDFPRGLSFALEAVHLIGNERATSRYNNPTLTRMTTAYTPRRALRATLAKRF